MSAPVTTEHLFQPVALPQQLLDLFERMQQSAGQSSGQQAALAVIEEYYSFFGAAGMRKDIWLLFNAAMCSQQVACLQQAEERYNLLFFCEFTLMLLDAVYLLHGNEHQGRLQ